MRVEFLLLFYKDVINRCGREHLGNTSMKLNKQYCRDTKDVHFLI